jgi:F-type H+-transporting ATPase subunit b
MSPRKLLLSAIFVVVGTGSVLAQPAPAEPAAPTAPAADPAPTAPTAPTAPAVEAEHKSESVTHEAEAHHDPSKHFNFLGSPGEHYGKDEFGGKLGDGQMVDPHTGEVVNEEEPMSPAFIYMVLNFAILVGLLAWKARPAVQKLAADRHDQIKVALDEAAKLRAQAAEKLAEYDSRLKAADAEISKLVEDMRVVAEADKKRILEAAERQAAQMKRDAEQRIAAEIETARAVLTREVTAAAAAATEQILREKMNPADQQKVVTTFITGVQAASKEAR